MISSLSLRVAPKITIIVGISIHLDIKRVACKILSFVESELEGKCMSYANIIYFLLYCLWILLSVLTSIFAMNSNPNLIYLTSDDSRT